MLTASEVAGALVRRASQERLSSSKVQSLLYYAQAWHLAIYDLSLFADEIEARECGPVAPAVLENIEKLKWVSLDEYVDEHLDCILKKYGSMNEESLRVLTRSEAPWMAARGAGERVIEPGDMKLFYRYPVNDFFIRILRVVLRVCSSKPD
jgi:uncharacterized phage-associated protein